MTYGRWNHLALTWDGATQYGYVNGELAVAIANPSVMGNGSGDWLVGGNPTSGEYYSGSIDDIRIETCCRTSDEIMAAYKIGMYKYYVSSSVVLA
jgi:hypothetical protein